MKYIVLLIICFSTQHILAQDATAYENTIKAFQENFNAQNVDAIFALYTPEMQETMTKEGVKRFVNGCHEQFGNLKKLTFIQTAENINSYTAEFEKISLVMELLLSPNGKIATIQFQEP
ncbi:DUF3887 domain-containing protein [Aquimarina algiphila]|uniref:DUF3887 domain-containing protein n=1 Tax=Aquimarina algiphila TaxID=2047982 RepID=A0A554VMM9_9FLAO|nr:DUF3887 domain-containing protein [Aquimarina algiphila]TSE09537.1 DUF3887 domain-containing protein [Aquimarina algiphila]